MARQTYQLFTRDTESDVSTKDTLKLDRHPKAGQNKNGHSRRNKVGRETEGRPRKPAECRVGKGHRPVHALQRWPGGAE